MKLLAITVGDKQTASTHFRLLQYFPDIEIIPQQELEPRHLKRLQRADCVIVQKVLLPRFKQAAIRKAARRLVFDFDDAIWTRPFKPYSFITRLRVQARLRYWMKYANAVTCANQVLADWARRYCTPTVIPMTVDTNVWCPKPSNTLAVGWAGAPVNLPHIERLEPVFKALPQVRLRVFCGQKPNLSVPFEYVPYSPEEQIPFMQSLAISLLPLTDEPFSRGKSPIKAIQSIACGVPVVGNIYGATKEILQPEFSLAVNNDWVESLTKLIEDAALRRQMSGAARDYAVSHFDRQVGIQLLQGVLCS